ncbi:MAG: hypothetical protein H8D87_04280 [Deltaproteobacteria bacterium]|uniref:hypothetical protein n=1 Tax=Desulfobacula sp. TaxID=2593537 RepID=UPI0019AF35F4|nr:hypothetical protein [Candidatus Desulfobacula maris]MBL6994987.1 hypothetical protein [Desulfobacula sp.]
MTNPKKAPSNTLSEEQKKADINFPCGNIEEMLRMFKKYCAKENFDCGAMMKHFMDKESTNICSNEMMTEMKKALKEYRRGKRA